MDASSDLTKLKVADLKNELKIRGLATTGKRTELLERLQEALAAGIDVSQTEDAGDYDEDEILAGEDGEDDALSPSEEAAALAAAEKVAATPRARRGSLAPATPATPRTAGRRLKISRTEASALTVPVEESTTPAKITPAPSPARTPAQILSKSPGKKTPASGPAHGEPAAKVAKGDSAEDTSDKENGEPAKSAMEKRMERFGIVSEQSQKEKRAERFGTANGKIASEPVDVEKLKSRAERFGETVAKTLTKADVEEKKKARSERFGVPETNGVKKDVDSDDAKAKRAARFAEASATTETKEIEPVISASGKTLITVGTEDAAKLKRAARFGA